MMNNNLLFKHYKIYKIAAIVPYWNKFHCGSFNKFSSCWNIGSEVALTLIITWEGDIFWLLREEQRVSQCEVFINLWLHQVLNFANQSSDYQNRGKHPRRGSKYQWHVSGPSLWVTLRPSSIAPSKLLLKQIH